MRRCVDCKWYSPSEEIDAPALCVNPWMLKRWTDKVTGKGPTCADMRAGHVHTACAEAGQYFEAA